jgi:hypothetical protein
MDARTRLAELELMEKLATLEADETPTAEPIQKTAAVSGDGKAAFYKKASAIIEASRRAGRARAEAEIASLYAR